MAHGIVFITARNCQKYISRAIHSLSDQTNSSFEIMFVDDNSSDDTFSTCIEELDSYFRGRYTSVKNLESLGKAASAYFNLKRMNADFVAILDGDDALVSSSILDEYSRYYDQGFDIVYSNYKTNDGRLGQNSDLNPLSNPRVQGWKTSHFFSFRLSLFKNIPQEYFKDANGQWLKSACDFAIAYPLLDQTRRYKFVNKVAYEYRVDNPKSHHNIKGLSKNLSSEEQKKNAIYVLNKPPLPLLHSIETSLAPYNSFLAKVCVHNNDRLQKLERQLQDAANTSLQREAELLAKSRLVLTENVPLEWLSSVGGWSLDLQVYEYLLRHLDRYKSPRVLEFGSGAGSKVLHHLVCKRGGTCISVEHDKEFFDRTSQELKDWDLYRQNSLILAPLIELEVLGRQTRFYDLNWLSSDSTFDLVIVDGPPEQALPLSRLAALPNMVKHLGPNSTLILDDFYRKGEREIVDLWSAKFPDLRYAEAKFTKSICVVKGFAAESLPII